MFIEFKDKDGDTLALHINQIVGFEFKDQTPTKVQLTTGKLAELQDDEQMVKAKFAEVSKFVGVQLYWEFKTVEPLTEEQQSEIQKQFATNGTGATHFPVVPSS